MLAEYLSQVPLYSKSLSGYFTISHTLDLLIQWFGNATIS